jgi:hypothetical protein
MLSLTFNINGRIYKRVSLLQRINRGERFLWWQNDRGNYANINDHAQQVNEFENMVKPDVKTALSEIYR